MFVLLLSGDGTVLAESTTRAQLPLLLAQAPNVSTVDVGQATETDTAMPMTVLLSGAAIIQVGLAEETDTALPMTIVVASNQTVPIGIAEETDTALSMTFVASGDVFIPIGIATETDEAFPIRVDRTYLVVSDRDPLALTPVTPNQLTLTPVAPE